MSSRLNTECVVFSRILYISYDYDPIHHSGNGGKEGGGGEHIQLYNYIMLINKILIKSGIVKSFIIFNDSIERFLKRCILKFFLKASLDGEYPTVAGKQFQMPGPKLGHAFSSSFRGVRGTRRLFTNDRKVKFD